VGGWSGCAVGVHDRQGDRVGPASVRAQRVQLAVGTQAKPNHHSNRAQNQSVNQVCNIMFIRKVLVVVPCSQS
jgi:hypothetical protein